MRNKLMAGCILLMIGGSFIHAQSITQWREQGGPLALGYPVPIPVNVAEPFDGFRTYQGLQNQWQSIDLDNPWIQAEQIGTTHKNRPIWAYLLGDENNLTPYGQTESAMMINGGIHAREWQSPESVTGIIELFHENSQDRGLYQYLLENSTIVTIPVLNVDGFLQTQRYPDSNWYSQSIGPRDGRMRRKNLRDTDENLNSQGDYLNGVDLNRNNPPYWASSNSSSSSATSIIYHGPSAQSEPEIQALLSAADLVEPDQLRIYTDLHSFSQVHYANRSFNNDLNILQSRVLSNFSQHHKALPGAKNYVDRSAFTRPGFGIGSTDEYFQNTYEIPAWTLETEPSNTLSPDAHPDLPGFSADYGGIVTNGHSGFIAPDSAIRRIREQLAQSFAVAWYTQAGPPAIIQYRLIDPQTDTIVFDAAWDADPDDENHRVFYSHAFAPLIPGRTYSLQLRFNKPMRYRNDSGEIATLPGHNILLTPYVRLKINDETIETDWFNNTWLNDKSSHWQSYGYYQDDTWVTDFQLPAELAFSEGDKLDFEIITPDMVGQNIDSNPQTSVYWSAGRWQNYEDSFDQPALNGGFDKHLSVPISTNEAPEMGLPVTALYYDPNRNGEGFSLETLNPDGDFWLQWFTYNDTGEARWYVAADGAMAANALATNALYTVNGGVFGPDYNPDETELAAFGQLEFIFDAVGGLSQRGYSKYTDPETGAVFRFVIEPFTQAGGLINSPNNTQDFHAAALIGSWFDPARNGEGFHLQILTDDSAVMQWFSFTPEGEKQWFVSSGGQISYPAEDTALIEFEDVLTARGGVFGPDFNPNDIVLERWGSLQFELGCEGGQVSYQAIDPDYGTGGYPLIRLTASEFNAYQCPEP